MEERIHSRNVGVITGVILVVLTLAGVLYQSVSWESLKYRLSRKNMRRHPLFLSLYGSYFQLRRWLGDERITDADPFKTIWLDPAEITYAVEGYKDTWGLVVDEDWEYTRFEDLERYQTLERHFVDGVHWEDLPLKTERGKNKDRVYERIASEGYKSQRELGSVLNPFRKRDHEIGVVIDADGEIFWTGRGRHRLCIAKILDVDQVPAQVHVRHCDWQAVRDEVRTTRSRSELSEQTRSKLDHPDLQDLLPLD